MKKFGLCLSCVCTRARGCDSAASKKNKKDAAVKKRAKAELRDENPDVDFQAFRRTFEKGCGAHDANTLASMMTEDFAYVLGEKPSEDRKGDGVFKYWDENGLWTELDAILTERFAKKGEFLGCAAAVCGRIANYTGYRVGVRRVGGSWKFVYFVKRLIEKVER